MSEDNNNDINPFKIIGAVGKGLGSVVGAVGQGIESVAHAAEDVSEALRGTITEITMVINTTDESVDFINAEDAQNNRKLEAQALASLRTPRTAGAYIPWYDPPRFDNFAKRHMAIHVNDTPLIYFWVRGEQIYWTRRVDAEGRPAKAYKMPGASYVRGQRVLVVRYDPEFTYSAYLMETRRIKDIMR